MAPPMVIMLNWRCVNLRLSSVLPGGDVEESLIGFTSPRTAFSLAVCQAL
jgi:hypothetical protein